MILDSSQVNLQALVLHHVGNKADEEGVRFSDSALSMDDEVVMDILKRYFLLPFKSLETFCNFSHPLDLNQNMVYPLISKIFENPANLVEQSVLLGEHLYNCTNHPKIKGGELYVVYFKDFVVEEELADAIGIFKSENKETYLKVLPQKGGFGLVADNGINIHKLDKGCLIFNTEPEMGYKLIVIDNTNKNNEAQYWKDDFLQVKPRADNFYATSNYLDVCKGFCEQIIVPENEYEKHDQIEFAQKASEYFQTREEFDINEFEEEVIEAPKLKQAFQDYKKLYQESNEIQLDETFDIAPNAAKTAKKYFKSVIKLDKNFHIYIHSKPEYIEKGFDKEKDLNFYKLYFDEEN